MTRKPRVFALSLAPDIPKSSGVYAIQTSSGKIKYIGGSKNLRKRYSGHLRKLIRKIHPNKGLQETFNKNKTVLFFKILETCPVESIGRLEQKHLDISLKTVTKLNRQKRSGSGH